MGCSDENRTPEAEISTVVSSKIRSAFVPGLTVTIAGRLI